MLRSRSLPWFAALLALLLATGRAADVHPVTVEHIRATLDAAFGPPRAEDGAAESLGGQLAEYARRPAGDPERCEGFEAAARRLLAGGTTTRITPETTARWLEQTADRLLEAADTPPPLRKAAHLARFHGRRALAAVHYNLFLRSLRLAELVAATLAEKAAVDAWRDLVRETGSEAPAEGWRAELKRLEAGMRELEEQCCPPDPVTLQEKIWIPEPAPLGDQFPLRPRPAGAVR